ncbi:hypothetical protein DBT54_09830 [Aerococcus loyolae]|uniref:Uncharacterized protein n=1 Tax=Aerococcus urinae TaxID=1376 RepID=A0A329NZ17_9LACT|nr:hypothetical protein DBT54_09830 [Aerococcus loyolae]
MSSLLPFFRIHHLQPFVGEAIGIARQGQALAIDAVAVFFGDGAGAVRHRDHGAQGVLVGVVPRQRDAVHLDPEHGLVDAGSIDIAEASRRSLVEIASLQILLS